MGFPLDLSSQAFKTKIWAQFLLSFFYQSYNFWYNISTLKLAICFFPVLIVWVLLHLKLYPKQS